MNGRNLTLSFWRFSAAAFLIFAFAATKLSAEVPNFAMLDQRGEYHELRRAEGKAVVLFFTANGCPVARQSVRKWKALDEKFGPEGVAFWMVNSNSGDDRRSIQREAREFGFWHMPVLHDETQGVAAMLDVKRTATVVCINTKDWSVFYQGAIDDQLTEGAQKPEPTERYLETALTQFLAGNPIETAFTVARGCIISIDKKPISYAADVAPILEQKCFTCHSPGNIGPFSMSSYRKVKGMSDMIREVIVARRMPPWHADRHHGKFQRDLSLSLEQAGTILRWIEQGAERGDGEDPLEKAVAPTQAWSLGEPDAVISLPKAETIPATGVLDYRHIRVKVPFEEDVWVKGVVAKPGNTRVVHHIIVRVKEPGQREDDPDDAFLIGWAPGSPEAFFPEGTGKLIKKGTVFDFEMHYTTSGREETDQSSIGLYFHKEKPRMVLKTHAAYDFNFEIPPGDPKVKTLATYHFGKESLLFFISPHMHLRGSSMKVEALYPNGKKETLLSVPKYDFKWQQTYALETPKRMPAGAWILCSGTFDNSAGNPDNPDPTKRVTWGDQSFDEMFIGFLGVAELPQDLKVTQAK